MDAWERAYARLEKLYALISNIDPSQRLVLWLQLIVGCLTILWILFQFAWLRRLNEARLERFLEDKLARDRDALEQERSRLLEQWDRDNEANGVKFMALYAWAHIRLTASLLFRLLSLGLAQGSPLRGVLLAQAGMHERARLFDLAFAKKELDKIKLHKETIDNRQMSAQNALIRAGRAAVAAGNRHAALTTFTQAARIAEDADTRLLLGRQLLMSGDDAAAAEQFDKVIGQHGVKPETRAEAHRGLASVHMARLATGKARRELGLAQTAEGAVANYRGRGKTAEMLGDLNAPRADRRNAAIQAYNTAIGQFALGEDEGSVARVREKLARLTESPPRTDGCIARLLERLGTWLIRQAERLRSRE